MKVYGGSLLVLAFLISCNFSPTEQQNKVEEPQPEQAVSFKKRPGISNDTIQLHLPSAVFFFPDSGQLTAYKMFIPGSFESSEHEYFYQINNAKSRLQSNWKQVEVIECKSAKYLQVAGEGVLFNLDEINEPWGLILFEKGKAPAHVDMMNIDTELENYFIKSRE